MQGFIVEGGPLRGKVFELRDPVVTIGREPWCQIQVDDADVSREHAAVRLDGDTPMLADLRSRNGTFVNDEKIKRKGIKSGDLIRVGRTVMRYKDQIMPEDRVLSGDAVEVYEPGKTSKEPLPPTQPVAADDAETSPLAWISLLCAVGAVSWVLAVVSVACGIAAVVRIKQRGDQKGMGLAALALLIGGLASAYHLHVSVLRPRLQSIRAANARMECRNNLRVLGEALTRYVGASGGEYPASLEDLYPLYVEERRRFVCPGDPEPVLGKSDLLLSYSYVGSKRGDRGAQTIVAFDREATHHGGKGRNVLYADGQVRWMPEQEVQERFPPDFLSRDVKGAADSSDQD